MNTHFTIEELVALTEISKRTIRYYVQIDLIDKPEGETRAARYGQKQLEQLLLIKKWSADGMSLDAIKRLLSRDSPIQVETDGPVGSSLMKTHVKLGRGLELVIDPGSIQKGHTELRHLISELIRLVESHSNEK